MKKASILIAYPCGEEPSALSLLEILNSLGTVLLRPYSRLKFQREKTDFDVALCVVVDEASITEAHDFRQRSENVPVIVVDSTSGRSIPVNGFSGLVSPAPQEIADAVSEILLAGECDEEITTRPKRRHSPLASRFDGILSRLGGIPLGFDTALAAASRHLAWELRSEHAEAYAVGNDLKARRVFTAPDAKAASAPMPEKALRVLQKRGRLTYVGDLNRRIDTPLLKYLNERDLNVVAPIMSINNIVGWLAMNLDDSNLTDDFLDDLHIATHLLSMSLSTPSTETAQRPDCWGNVLASFKTSLVIVSSDGAIVESTGQTLLLGGALKVGQSFKTIRRGRVREVVAEALRGNLLTETWYDSNFETSVECTASQIDSGEIALRLCLLKKRQENASPQIELSPFFETLPVPVVAESGDGASSSLSTGTISVADSEAILRCATAAKSKNVKSLKVRCTNEDKKGRAVVFFETSVAESDSQLEADIAQAVEFNITFS